MKLQYNMKDMKLKNKALFIGDFTMYFGEAKYELKEDVESIANNKGAKAKLVNAVRKFPGMTGFNIDILLSGLETAHGTDVFTFKVNGETLDNILNDQRDVELEIYMNPLYFITKAAVYQHFPGFRTKHDTIEVIAKRHEDAWVKRFESNLSKYHPRNKWVKTILEE